MLMAAEVHISTAADRKPQVPEAQVTEHQMLSPGPVARVEQALLVVAVLADTLVLVVIRALLLLG